MTGGCVVVGPGVAARIDVDDDLDELGHGVEEAVADALGDGVGPPERHVFVDQEVELGPEMVAQPADPQVAYPLDPLGRASNLLHLFHHCRIDRVHQSMPHRHRSVFADEEDGDGDQESDDRIGDGRAEPDGHRAEEDAERRQPVDLSVLAVGFERG